MIVLVSSALALNPSKILSAGQQTRSPLPFGQLSFGAFTARFVPDGTFSLEGEGWPAFKGTWTADHGQIELLAPKRIGAVRGCDVCAIVANAVRDREALKLPIVSAKVVWL